MADYHIILPESTKEPPPPLDYEGYDIDVVSKLRREIHNSRLGTTSTADDCRLCHDFALARLRSENA